MVVQGYIRGAREAKGLTRATLADLVGVTRYTVYLWEHGQKMTAENALKLSRALGVPIQRLIQ